MAASAALARIARPSHAARVPPPPVGARPVDRQAWIAAYREVRAETERRAAPLSAEDQQIQSMEDASRRSGTVPTSRGSSSSSCWRSTCRATPSTIRACTTSSIRITWPPVRVSRVPARPHHRPTCDEVAAYRAHVDRAVDTLLTGATDEALDAILPILEIGLSIHERSIRSCSGRTSCMPSRRPPWIRSTTPIGTFPGQTGSWGVTSIRASSPSARGGGLLLRQRITRHDSLVLPVRIERALVTNREWLRFIEDGGYGRQDLWLNDGWYAGQNHGWGPRLLAPGWGIWVQASLGGPRPIDLDAP